MLLEQGNDQSKLTTQLERMLEQMGVSSFENFCYGRHWDALFHNIERCFTQVKPGVRLLAYLIARQNLFTKKYTRAALPDKRPEYSTNVRLVNGTIQISSPKRDGTITTRLKLLPII